MSIERTGTASTGTASTGMRTSWYDSATSFLMATMLMLGSLVGALFLVWLFSAEPDEMGLTSPPVQKVSHSPDIDLDNDFVTPAGSEVTNLTEVPVDVNLRAISSIAGLVAANVDLSSVAKLTDERTVGVDSGENEVPRFERWQIHFAVTSIDEYAKLLDHHQIELAAIGGNIQGVDCVHSFSNSPTVRRITDPSQETRLYFMWTDSSPLAKFDRQLIASANVPTEGRHVLKFISAKLEDELAILEVNAAIEAGYMDVSDIAQTIFRNERTGNGFPFVVVEQRFR